MASNDPRPTKAERREAARAKAQALREEQARKAHRAAITRRAAIGVGGVAVVGGIGGLIWKSKSSEGDDENGQEKAPDLNTEKGSLVPSSVDPESGALTYGSDLKVGTSNEGAPVLDIYFDYSCPHCAEFEALHSAEMKSLVTDGKVTLVLHPAHVLKLKWTIWAYNAMGVVLDKEPDKALDLHTALFSRFEQAAAKRDVTLLQKKGIWETASGAGLSSDTQDAIKEAVKSSKYDKWIDLSNQAFQTNGKEKGFSGTPAVLYNGQLVDLQQLQAENSLADYVNGQQGGAGAPAASPSEAPATTPAP